MIQYIRPHRVILREQEIFLSKIVSAMTELGLDATREQAIFLTVFSTNDYLLIF